MHKKSNFYRKAESLVCDDSLSLGTRVKVLSTGYIGARQYIGKVGRLDHIEYDARGRPVNFHVKFKDDMVIASGVEKEIK